MSSIVVSSPRNQPNSLDQAAQVPSDSPLKAAGLDDFYSTPENQRSLLQADEVARVLNVLGLQNVHYKKTIAFKSGAKEVAFPFYIYGMLYTLFCKLYSQNLLSGIYIKGSTNKHFFDDRTDIPGDVDCHIQAKIRNSDEMESMILSVFADVGGITAEDSGTKRIYWQGSRKICEISPVPPRPPGFFRHRNCGRLLLEKNGLGNRCYVDDDNRKFLLFTLNVFCGEKPIKIDIHVVEKLDHQATCSYNAIQTAIHPLFFAQYHNLDPNEVQLWARSVDGYPFETAFADMNAQSLVYDPPGQAATIHEGLHIHHRYLARGVTCLSPGVDKYLHEQFLRQYYERVEEKGNTKDP